jgi:hypothetical protein
MLMQVLDGHPEIAERFGDPATGMVTYDQNGNRRFDVEQLVRLRLTRC